MSRAGFAPQCAALLRSVHGGEIEVYMVSCSKFSAWLAAKSNSEDTTDNVNMAKLQEEFCNLTCELQ